jgi:hypothetical protein
MDCILHSQVCSNLTQLIGRYISNHNRSWPVHHGQQGHRCHSDYRWRGHTEECLVSAATFQSPGVGQQADRRCFSYVKMVAVAKAGGELTTYSDRFSYSGMLGKWDAATKAALATIDGTKGPKAVDNTVAAAKPANPVAAAPAAPEAGDFDVEYTMQTGPTRYAPMQPVPPTKVTATNTKPLYPTSSVKIATTFLPIPDIQTTITQSQTYSVSSRANTVCNISWQLGIGVQLEYED